MDFLKAYKTRQDDIVRAIGEVQKLLELGSTNGARNRIAELLARELKQAKDRQDNHTFALNIAIKALEHADMCDDRDEKVCADALSQIELLVPEAFEKTPAPAASVTS